MMRRSEYVGPCVGLLLFLIVVPISALRLHHQQGGPAEDPEEDNPSAAYVVKKPVNLVRTRIEDVGDEEWSAPDMVPAKHRTFNVSILTHKVPDLISQELQQTGNWDTPDVQRICTEFIKQGGKGNILDVGANIGAYTLPLAACLKENGKGSNRVISVEAAPWNARHLRAGMKYNGMDNVDLWEYALGSKLEKGFVDMSPYEGNYGMSGLTYLRQISRSAPAAPPFNQTLVPLVTLDDIARAEGAPMQNILVMKIDIEGHEGRAFEGATDFFKSSAPCFIWIELKNLPGLKAVIEDLGYDVQMADHDHDENAWCVRKDLKRCVANLE